MQCAVWITVGLLWTGMAAAKTVHLPSPKKGTTFVFDCGDYKATRTVEDVRESTTKGLNELTIKIDNDGKAVMTKMLPLQQCSLGFLRLNRPESVQDGYLSKPFWVSSVEIPSTLTGTFESFREKSKDRDLWNIRFAFVKETHMDWKGKKENVIETTEAADLTVEGVHRGHSTFHCWWSESMGVPLRTQSTDLTGEVRNCTLESFSEPKRAP